jgi:hypothetical protein
MRFNLAGTVNRLNVEHRTSNIERPILMALRFIDLKTSESQNTEPQPATSPSVVSSGLKDSGSNDSRLKDSGSNDSLRQAQGLSLSKAAESNFEW